MNPELGSAFDQLAAKFAGEDHSQQESLEPAEHLCNM